MFHCNDVSVVRVVILCRAGATKGENESTSTADIAAAAAGQDRLQLSDHATQL